MKKTFTASCFFVATFLCSFGQTTDSLMDPRVWLNAERSELTANLWSDLSIYKNDATAGFPGNIPSSSTLINFNKSLVFDGVDDYLKIPFSLDGRLNFQFSQSFIPPIRQNAVSRDRKSHCGKCF